MFCGNRDCNNCNSDKVCTGATPYLFFKFVSRISQKADRSLLCLTVVPFDKAFLIPDFLDSMNFILFDWKMVEEIFRPIILALLVRNNAYKSSCAGCWWINKWNRFINNLLKTGFLQTSINHPKHFHTICYRHFITHYQTTISQSLVRIIMSKVCPSDISLKNNLQIYLNDNPYNSYQKGMSHS